VPCESRKRKSETREVVYLEEGERTDRGFLKKEERRGISSSNFLGNGKRRAVREARVVYSTCGCAGMVQIEKREEREERKKREKGREKDRGRVLMLVQVRGAAGHAWGTCLSKGGLTIVAGGLRVQIQRKRP